MSEFGAILLAAGSGSRMGQLTEERSKALLSLNYTQHNTPKTAWILELSLELLVKSACFSEIVIVTRVDELGLVREKLAHLTQAENVSYSFTTGGDTRQESVARGVEAFTKSISHIAIHDAARPCCLAKDVKRVCDIALEEGAAALGVRIVQTLKRSSQNQQIIETIDRDNVWEIQTPQVFERELLIRAHASANSVATDDCGLVERIGSAVYICEGRRSNFKITSEEDIAYAEFLLSRQGEN